ncbi:MAG: DUF58 domain-containing protein [Gammaproteobacteria bacterium]|nr:DUF58 domain-containing protein [Gammaproteobacteria bacterium]
MIPARRLFLALWLLAALGLAAALWPVLAPVWGWALAALAGLTLVDALAAWRMHPPQVRRELAGSLPLGVRRPVTLRVHNPGRRRLRFEIYDHHPEAVTAEGLPQGATLAPDQHVELGYRIRPVERGELVFPAVQLRLGSPLGLWQRSLRLPLEDRTQVYPNFAAVSKYILLAMDNRLSQMGILKRRRRGEGQDFHQLREYRRGDSPRQIDWKASSRMRKLIAREYQDERDQEVVFLVDCGHRMFTRDDALSHFDHTLNALLLLGYVALRQGDAVGLGTFSGEQRWLRPAKGQAQLNHILNTVYDLQPTTQAPDYAQAVTQFLARQKKRALVIVITNLRDEDSEDLLPALHLLKKRHLVLLASMQERALEDVLQGEVEDFDDAIRVASTHRYLASRRRTFENVQASGILSLDVPPDRLSVALVNSYLDIKRSGRL